MRKQARSGKRETKTDVLTLVYEAKFDDVLKESVFIFNTQNQLKELQLLPMSVKATTAKLATATATKPYFTVPFKRIGNLISVEARLNGEIKNFIVDNGAPIFILNAAHIEKDTTSANTKRVVLSGSQGVGGGITETGISAIENFDFEGITMTNDQVITTDLTHLEEITKEKIHGLLGYAVYQDYDLLFDYGKNTISFIKPEFTEDFLKKQYKSKKQIEVPIQIQSHLAVIEIYIKNKKYTMAIDCGAEAGLFHSALKDELIGNFKDLKTESIAGADKNAVEGISGKLNVMNIGKLRFKNTEAAFSDISHLNSGYDLSVDGLVGYDVLSAQPTLLSYKNKKMIFLK